MSVGSEECERSIVFISGCVRALPPLLPSPAGRGPGGFPQRRPGRSSPSGPARVCPEPARARVPRRAGCTSVVLATACEVTEGAEGQNNYPVGGLGPPRVREAGGGEPGLVAPTVPRPRKTSVPPGLLQKPLREVGLRRAQPITRFSSRDVRARSPIRARVGVQGCARGARAASHRPGGPGAEAEGAGTASGSRPRGVAAA